MLTKWALIFCVGDLKELTPSVWTS